MKDITGKKFGKWVVIKRFGIAKHGNSARWLCRCDCGTIKDINSHSLRRGDSKSCGCLPRAKRTHGMCNERFYTIWNGIKIRTNDKNNPLYGGKGVMCLWKSFEEFRDDMYKSYHEHVKKHGERQTSIDRIDSNGHYSKKNCRWATRIEQGMNTRTNNLIEFQGEIKPMKQWSYDYDIKYVTLWARIMKYNWPVEKALTKEVR